MGYSEDMFATGNFSEEFQRFQAELCRSECRTHDDCTIDALLADTLVPEGYEKLSQWTQPLDCETLHLFKQFFRVMKRTKRRVHSCTDADKEVDVRCSVTD